MARGRTEPKCPQRTAEVHLAAGARRWDPSPLVEVFARAITKSGARALLIGKDNREGGWVSLLEAVSSGRAFAVEVDEAVLALDADNADTGSYVEHELAPSLANSGLRPVVMASGGEGRRHCFVRVEDPDIRLRLADHARSLGIDVRLVIRPPFAPHRAGLPVVLMYPSAPEEALQSLQPKRVLRLPSSLFDLMRRGERTGHDKSDSALLWRIELVAVNAGISGRWLFKALLDPKNLGGKKLQKISAERGEAAALQYFEADFERARLWIAQHPKMIDRSSVEAELDNLRGTLEQEKWTGIGGATRHDVLLAHLSIARQRGRLTYYASVRQLGERAGVAAISASRANERLECDGWIRLAAEAAFGMPRLWSILRRSSDTTVTFRAQGGREAECDDNVAPPAHDAFRWRALGKAKRLIYCLLDLHKGHCAKEIAAIRKVHVRTAQRHLRALARHRMAACDDDGLWRRLLNADLEEVAKAHGSFGKGESERGRHRSEREAFFHHSASLKGWQR